MEIVDSLGKHISLDYIRFDPQYENPENRIFIRKEMQNAETRKWRLFHEWRTRDYEADFIIR